MEPGSVTWELLLELLELELLELELLELLDPPESPPEPPPPHAPSAKQKETHTKDFIFIVITPYQANTKAI
ncbi:hypothetical protein QWI17_16430 [Gilvimarinus sp. SDUM040013]|uniref:Uncharacterized protein n=1 Tax=Gilvimarinus gilvus TaxID=3058038 RepID=A0ABU4RYG4_9GAMM|nr:hypothetical protein [Gilvimarinus sp. SDUM040013]MDO3387430.1 hypothetical protein [Gilvimarinus sp. SDUM040013]MDX6849907.1 hypothetical protein [Gilvimarinus sp. SDUM040013]